MGTPRWALAGLCLLCVLMTAMHVGGLLADVYARAAIQRQRGAPTSVNVSAMQNAIHLQPWRSGLHAQLGWAFGVLGETPRMQSRYRSALHWAPASAYLWMEYAQALARARRFDADYTLALQQATQFAPNSKPIQFAAARMGAMHWNQGGEADRRLWARTMSYALRTAPYEFLWKILQQRREASFCGHVGDELGLTRWCFAVQAARGICDSLPAGAQGPPADACTRLGLEIPVDEAVISQ